MRLRALFSVVLIALLMCGCTSIISATNEGPIDDAPGERSFGAVIDDEIIETKVLVNIRAADPQLEESHIVVNSYNGVVLLAGQVPSDAMRQLAAQTAAAVKRVRRVHNELIISGKTSMLVRSNDSWISTKVKSRLGLEDGLDATRIKVITENGVVYLMGIVRQVEADKAAEIARSTGGVQKVVRIFEYY